MKYKSNTRPKNPATPAVTSPVIRATAALLPRDMAATLRHVLGAEALRAVDLRHDTKFLALGICHDNPRLAALADVDAGGAEANSRSTFRAWLALAIATTSAGVIRVMSSALFRLGDDVAWAGWLPAGHQLIAGNVDNDYIVRSSTLPARPFAFDASPGRALDSGRDVNYSPAVVLGG